MWKRDPQPVAQKDVWLDHSWESAGWTDADEFGAAEDDIDDETFAKAIAEGRDPDHVAA